MHRLFVALRPPPDIRDPLIDTMEGVEGARWQSDEQLHLTLRFVGEADTAQANDLVSALEAVRAPRFTLQLRGLGTFERKGRTRALWAKVDESEPLAILHRRSSAPAAPPGWRRRHASSCHTSPSHGSTPRPGRSAGGLPRTDGSRCLRGRSTHSISMKAASSPAAPITSRW